MPTITKINTQPNDFITSGTGAAATGTGTISTASQSANNTLVQGFDPVNLTPVTSYNGTTVQTAPHFEYSYDFARDGGAVSNVTLDGPVLPVGFRITNVVWCPSVAFTSGGAAQISLGTATGTPANLLAAAVLGTNGTTGPKAGIPVYGTLANSIRITTASTPVIGITVAALTAGSGKLIIDGFMDVTDNAA